MSLIKEEIKSINNSPESLRKFGMTVGLILVIIGSVMFWYGTDGFIFFTAAGTFLVFFALVHPPALKPFNIAWMSLAVLLGFIMSRVILSVLYYLVLTPVALIAKITGKKFIEPGFDNKMKTYWNYKENKNFERSEYERQF